jgi:hypothetical protein
MEKDHQEEFEKERKFGIILQRARCDCPVINIKDRTKNYCLRCP